MPRYEDILEAHPDVRDASGRFVRELHGVSLKQIVDTLVRDYGFVALSARIPIDCFSNEPSVSSTLNFLRRMPWARAKVEGLYVALKTAEILGLPKP